MLFLFKLLLKSSEIHCMVSLLVIVIVLTLFYFSNYFRICYYVYNIPGPRAYPIIGNALMLLGTHKEMSKKLFNTIRGDIPLSRIWFGPVPLIITIHPKFIQELLNNSHGLEKPIIMRMISYELAGDSLLISHVPKWKLHRSIIVRGFTPTILKSYFKVFVEKSQILVKKLEQEMKRGESFDILDYISKTSVDSICGSTMGVDINAQEREVSYFTAMQRCMYLITERGFHPWKYPDFLYHLTQDYKQMKRNMSVIWALASKVINEKRNNIYPTTNNNLGEEEVLEDIHKNVLKKPLLDYLIDFTENNPEFSDKDMRDEINLVIMAGYETSANALSYALLNLAARKEIQEKVCEELFSVLEYDLDRTIDFDDLPKLKYMEMVIKESMRLFTTVPVIGRQVTSDIIIDNHVIPKGSTCAVPIFCLHRDKNLWKDPLKFDPERFTPENIKNRHPYAYIPFSGGPRNCIGMRYAMIFLKTVMAALLTQYEFHTDIDLNRVKFEIEVSLKLIGGHRLQITPRNKKL